jgi:hypothetical protein
VNGLGQGVSRHWVVAALLGGALLLALTPAVMRGWPAWLVLTWLQLPAYMLHQVEEHAGDRFRLFVNTHIGGGREALTHAAVAVINLPGVWGIDALALSMAVFLRPGFGLIAVYLALVNAVVHVAAALVQRRYNPGLVTAVVVFLPLSAVSLGAFAAVPGVGVADHALGLLVAVAVHVAIIVHVRRRLVALA